MCFGVRDALQDHRSRFADPTQVTIHGELVHNPQVTRRLAEAGFPQSPEDDRRLDGPDSDGLDHGARHQQRGTATTAGRQQAS